MSQTVLGLARTFGIDPALVTVQGGSRKDRPFFIFFFSTAITGRTLVMKPATSARRLPHSVLVVDPQCDRSSLLYGHGHTRNKVGYDHIIPVVGCHGIGLAVDLNGCCGVMRTIVSGQPMSR